MTFTAFVSFPDAKLTEDLVIGALNKLEPKPVIVSELVKPEPLPLLQWSTYDEISHSLTLTNSHSVLSSTYVIRKSLIRKHFLHRSVQEYVAKNAGSILRESVPLTWDIEVQWADELDEMWVDELYELGKSLPETTGDIKDEGDAKWYILKPGMADRGMGIRMFRTKQGLQAILESFEEDEEDEDEEDKNGDKTAIVASQLRHFVIQEYLSDPLLIDPCENMSNPPTTQELQGKKFHLRAYCVAEGALNVYLFPKILALFSSIPYSRPSLQKGGDETTMDLRAHLTNSALQTTLGEENVRLLTELVGSTVLSGPERRKFTEEDVERLINQVALVLGEVFKPALDSAVHFQTLPNAFELFGVDLLVTHSNSGSFGVSVLELNAEPAIHLTGERLSWVLEELFEGIARTCVAPFFGSAGNGQHEVQSVKVGDMSHGLKCCLAIEVRGAGGW